MTQPVSTPYDESAQAAAGVTVNEPAQEDYFGFAEDKYFYFPDGKTFVIFKIMNEGSKAQYQKSTNKDINLNRNSGDIRVKVDPASERHALLESSIINWNLVRQGQPLPFSTQNLKNFLQFANPKIVQDIEQAIRLANPWMQDDMTIEQIDEEIKRLDEMKDAVKKREAEKAGSFDK